MCGLGNFDDVKALTTTELNNITSVLLTVLDPIKGWSEPLIDNKFGKQSTSNSCVLMRNKESKVLIVKDAIYKSWTMPIEDFSDL